MANRWRTRFDEAEADPLLSLANLVDVMLVFACGLMAALVAARIGTLPGSQQPDGGMQLTPVTRGRELPKLPQGIGTPGQGFESVGQVYRDPETGKLLLVGR
jgi:hypothetical protein